MAISPLVADTRRQAPQRNPGSIEPWPTYPLVAPSQLGNPFNEDDLATIFDALTQEIEREYRRFYGA